MQDFRNLDVWKKAHALVLAVYAETRSLPREEIFGVTMQLRRSATSIATRIAEGCGRDTSAAFAADLRRAIVACNETEYNILLAADLAYLHPETHNRLTADVVEVRKMIFGLLRRL